MDKKSIIEIKKYDGTSRRGTCDYCNTFNCEIAREETNVLNLGRNNSSVQIALCDECLDVLADRLWQHLEHNATK